MSRRMNPRDKGKASMTDEQEFEEKKQAKKPGMER
jgi:hypothetical protein